MATERRNGAGARLAGLLERPARPDQPVEAEEPEQAPEPAEGDDGGSTPAKGRGGASKKVRGRTVYIPDDLFERIIVQAHRRDLTISDYVVGILERQVPDHRVIRPGEGDGTAAA